MGVKWWGCAKNVILKGIEACRSGEGCRKNGGWETDAGLKTRGYKDGEKIAGLNAHHCKDKEKAAGLAPPRYREEKKKCRGRRNRARGSAAGWIATKAWDGIAWSFITVKDYYLRGIIRRRLAEVAGFEWVGGSFVVW
jgi:hypothetical protein